MDNFFQILFFLFIIFSFLAPLFKKKPEQKGGQSKPPVNTPNTQKKTQPENSQEDYDILEEIQGLFKPPDVAEEPVKPSEDEKTYDQTPYETPEWEKALKTEHTVNEEWHRPTTEADYIKEADLIQEEADRFQKLVDEAKKPVNVRLINLKKSLKNPDTIREYYLISEILGKPRAFKRQVR